MNEQSKLPYDGNIVNYDGDVVINSVGITSTIFGGICGSIVEASKSEELRKIIESVNDYYSVGEFFITDGYSLPARHIIHLITPHHDNDPDYKQIKECIRRILNECKYRHWKRVGFPLIGTGANKYNPKRLYEILSEMCSAYHDSYSDMNITIVSGNELIALRNEERITRESYNDTDHHDPKTKAKFKKGSKVFEATFKPDQSSYNKKYFAYDSFSLGRDEIIFDSSEVRTIGDYVDAYIDEKVARDALSPTQTKIRQKIVLYFAKGKKGKDDVIHAGSDAYGEIRNKNFAEKKQFFKIILALKMSYSEASSFLNYFGYSFAKKGINTVDDTIRELINNRQYGMVEVDLEFKKRHLKSLFLK